MKRKEIHLSAWRTAAAVLMAALLLASRLAEAAGQTWDYSDDFEGYAAAVAEINARQAPGRDGRGRAEHKERETSPLCCVLVMTDDKLPETDGLVYSLAGPRNRYTLFYASEDAAESAIGLFRASKGTRYAERDAELCAGSTGGFLSWGAKAMGYGDYLNHCLSCGGGSAVIAIVDSGISPHPLLTNRVIESGYDYVDADGEADDHFGHGTQVAGIAADCTHGLPVYLYPIRVLNAVGKGRTSNVINAIEEACRKGVDVINLSMESFAISEALDEAIRSAIERNIVVVAAAGNSACDTQYVSPAHMTDPGIIVVGSAERGDEGPIRAPYSNYGESVDVYAYGSEILCCDLNGDYSTQSGTSMAAPHVSGLCAMLRLIHPGISPAQMSARLASVCHEGNVNVPDLARMVPEEMGFHLTQLTLTVGKSLALPAAALPVTACETIEYASDDKAVADIIDSTLYALAPGTARVTAGCPGLAAAFELEVVPDDGTGALRLPERLTVLEAGAFEGDTSLKWVVLPEGLSAIGDGAFDRCWALEAVVIPACVTDIGENTFSNAVLLCASQSAAHAYARANGLQYIAVW